MVGAEVTRFKAGDRVAVQSSHSSMVMAAENEVFACPTRCR